MSAPRGGSFTTFLLMVPLAAIPLMAIFGIPEFAQLSASTEPTEPDILRQPMQGEGEAASDSTERYRSMASDLFRDDDPATGDSSLDDAPLWGQSSTASVEPPTRPNYGFRTAGSEPTPEPQQPSPRPMQTAAVTPAVEQPLETIEATPTASGLTWKQAARKLEDVGIHDYRLERGSGANQFLFVCLFSPGNDARIIRRFEAEADEPLQAVEDVLGQVDRWLEHRYSENLSWAR